ncbi:Rho GDP-dissociation inhibitor [Trichinella spiralis]|uniref:Rho GDP-dissociation inhibitor n=2 Tax=Trichinella spiralis TaxID=6334 RepID=A0ABR3KD84_TRISP
MLAEEKRQRSKSDVTEWNFWAYFALFETVRIDSACSLLSYSCKGHLTEPKYLRSHFTDIYMADTAHLSDEENGQDLVDTHSCYKAPAQKSVQEIFAADADDLSLRKYKEQLLGSSSENVVIDESNPKNVIVRKLTLIVNGRPDVVMNLEDISKMEKQSFVLKEGCQYHLEVGFHVQREIVAGLKYVQKVYRLGVQVAKDEYMVGSYPPRKELHTFRTPLEEAPSGMVQRGSYNVKSLFTDDDKNVLLKWEWNLEIKKDWD